MFDAYLVASHPVSIPHTSLIRFTELGGYKWLAFPITLTQFRLEHYR
jgi:hypothetical protein